jgi:hypothetical protein
MDSIERCFEIIRKGGKTEPDGDPVEGKCVFCGLRPESKTKEHVIPLWLIKLTGDPNRTIRVGSFEQKRFAFDQLVFPACESCNGTYSELEQNVKPIMVGMLNGQPINEPQAETLLDWFDKVRIGLWLAGLMLFKNPSGIVPNYYISTRERIQSRDRILYIGRPNQGDKALSFHAIDDLVFQHVPCFMLLYVNGFSFVNGAFVGFCGAALGLPKVRVQNWVGPNAHLRLTMPPRSGWRDNWPAAPKGFSILAQANFEGWSRDIFTGRQDLISHMQSGRMRSKIHLQIDGHLRVLNETPGDVLSVPFNNVATMLGKAERLFVRLRKYVVDHSGNVPDQYGRAWKQVIKIAAEAPTKVLLGKSQKTMRKRKTK